MKSKINFWAIFVFYFIAITCRYLTNKVGVIDNIGNEFLKSILTGIGPTLGAIAVFSIFKIKPIMNLKGNYKKIILPIIIYWIFPVLLISVVSFFMKGTFPWILVFSILIYGLFEEIGWRGFLYQHLKPLPLYQNLLIVSSLWFVWHMNFQFSTSNFIFYGIIILGTWGIGKVADSTNSLIAVSAFHSLNNFFPNLDATKILLLIILIIVWIVGLIIKKRINKIG